MTIPQSPQDLLRTCRKLFLRRHEVNANIGIHSFEKVGTQRLWIDVELYVPFVQTSPRKDDIREVLDYDFIRHFIARRIGQGHIGLQETLCDDLARGMLEHPSVQAVRLSTCKPDVYPDCEAVGVEVFLTKHSL